MFSLKIATQVPFCPLCLPCSTVLSVLCERVQELLQLFEDMAVMVETQGEVLNTVEANVGTAHVEVQMGTKHLAAARESQKSTARWWIYLAGIIVTVLAVALIIAVGFMGIKYPLSLYIQLGIGGVALVAYVILGILLMFYLKG